MMKNKIYIAIIVLVSAFLSGCYEDKGHYDYDKNNAITIDLGTNYYSKVAGETISIKPVFSFALDSNETGLTYNWTLGGQFLSDQRNLEYLVDTIWKTDCILRVLDTKSGITYLGKTTFDMTEKHNTQGWLILSDKGGESVLSYIRENLITPMVWIEYPDVYRSENKVSLGTKPVGILEHFFYKSQSSSVWLIQQGGESIDVDGRSLMKDVSLGETFADPAFASALKPKGMVEMRWLSGVLNEDGKVYTRKKLSDESYHTGKFLNFPLEYDNKEVNVQQFVIAPFMGAGYTLMLEGEKPDQRFLALIDKDKANAGKVLPLTVDSYPGGSEFRLDGLGDVDVLYLGTYRVNGISSGKNGYCVILKDAAGGCHYMDFSIAKMTTANAVVATPNVPKEFDLTTVIDGKNIFYPLPYEKAPYLLVSKGKVLYYINRANIGRESLIYYCTFNDEITAIDAEVNNSERVGVGLANGEFHVMDFSVAGLKAEEAKRYLYSAVSREGKIVDIRYKIKTGNGWPR